MYSLFRKVIIYRILKDSLTDAFTVSRIGLKMMRFCIRGGLKQDVAAMAACAGGTGRGIDMLDREGFRPNVGIILLNANNEVWWGKRIREHSWQFPQGGIKHGETPEQAMYRELMEETGLRREHVKVVGRTRDWLRYEVPPQYIRREIRGHYRGQKQIWFLLRMVGRDSDFNLRLTNNPEFDAWRWHEYWVPLDVVIEFKRDVYFRALSELSRFLVPPPVLGGEAQPGRKRPRRRRRPFSGAQKGGAAPLFPDNTKQKE